MPLTPTVSHVHVPRAPRHLRRRLVQSVQCALVLLLVACLGDQLHASEHRSERSVVASRGPRTLSPNPEGGELHNSSESSRTCLTVHRRAAAVQTSSARAPLPAHSVPRLPYAVRVFPRTPSEVRRRPLADSGRSALAASCRWRVEARWSRLDDRVPLRDGHDRSTVP